MPQRTKLTRFLVRLLRRQPAASGLTLDADGFAPISAVWQVVQAQFPGKYTLDDLLSLKHSDTGGKQRFEIRDSPPRIRVLFGIQAVRCRPPGTTTPKSTGCGRRSAFCRNARYW